MADTATRLRDLARQRDSRMYQMDAGMRLSDALAYIDLPTHWPAIHPVLREGLQTTRQIGDNFHMIYHLMRLGCYAQQVGETEQAAAWLQHALTAISPSTDRAAFFRKEIYKALSAMAKGRGDQAEALRYAEMSLSAAYERGRFDVIVEAQRHLAQIQHWLGERGEALYLIDSALATSRRENLPHHIVACRVLQVILLWDVGLAEQAKAIYAELWATEYQNPDRYQEIGTVAYKPMGDVIAAERAFQRFLAARPTHADGSSKLALVYFDQGQVAAAVRAWRSALTSCSQHPAALAGLALGLWTLGEHAEARTSFDRAVRLRPQVVDSAYLDEEFGWSAHAVDKMRPLIQAFHARAASQNSER
jgi:tetratricopeptide (TPR) repeat protein